MTTGGWITMALSVGFVTVLFVWCVSKVLRGQKDAERFARVEPVSDDDADAR